jgi:hypothetical protein
MKSKWFESDTLAYTILLVLLFALGSLSSMAQDSKVRLEGTTFVQVKSDKVSTKNDTKTQYTYEAKDGKKYPIYLSKNGKAYIIRVSKKTGREYKQYLPEVTEQLSKGKEE